MLVAFNFNEFKSVHVMKKKAEMKIRTGNQKVYTSMNEVVSGE
jgi:hypothetical protein